MRPRVNRPGPLLAYTTARVALFAVVLAVLYLLGMRQLLLLVAAVVVSGLLSFVLLARLRDQVSASVVSRSESVRHRFRARTSAEDAPDDARRAAADAPVEDAPTQPPPSAEG